MRGAQHVCVVEEYKQTILMNHSLRYISMSSLSCEMEFGHGAYFSGNFKKSEPALWVKREARSGEHVVGKQILALQPRVFERSCIKFAET